ncbi:MAG: hypothetical protein BWY66_01858 [bacterium ADurb.Bin374]|nr:MAG: hypothetical protein BWY66_01858 [bacterium ADurb.Bin374]
MTSRYRLSWGTSRAGSVPERTLLKFPRPANRTAASVCSPRRAASSRSVSRAAVLTDSETKRLNSRPSSTPCAIELNDAASSPNSSRRSAGRRIVKSCRMIRSAASDSASNGWRNLAATWRASMIENSSIANRTPRRLFISVSAASRRFPDGISANRILSAIRPGRNDMIVRSSDARPIVRVVDTPALSAAADMVIRDGDSESQILMTSTSPSLLRSIL